MKSCGYGFNSMMLPQAYTVNKSWRDANFVIDVLYYSPNPIKRENGKWVFFLQKAKISFHHNIWIMQIMVTFMGKRKNERTNKHIREIYPIVQKRGTWWKKNVTNVQTIEELNNVKAQKVASLTMFFFYNYFTTSSNQCLWILR